MKIISKIIVWMLSLIVVFVVANLIIWCFQYKWINNYIQVLNDKDWSDTMAQVTLKNPASIFTIFYEEGYIKSENDELLIENWDIANTTDKTTTDSITKESNNIDPYDPEFEDEFNSFFGGENSDTVQEIEHIVQDNVVEENDIYTGHSVAEELIKKFNE